MKEKFVINTEQRKALSQFFNGVAIAWFAGAFITQTFGPEATILQFIIFVVNMSMSLYLSLYLLKEDL